MKGYLVGIDRTFEKNCRILHQNDELFHISIKSSNIEIQIIFCYISPKSKTNLSSIFQLFDPDIPYCVLTGDLNARIGNYQPVFSNTTADRCCKDNFVSPRGREIIRCLETSNFHILNGNSKSDPHGEYTFCTKNGSSTIDLSLCSSDLIPKTDFEVLEETISSHFPILTTIEGPKYLEGISEYTKLTWDVNKADSYRNSLDFILKYSNNSNDVLSFTNSMLQAAHDIGLSKTRVLDKIGSVQYPRWFDNKCLASKKHTTHMLRKYRKSFGQTNHLNVKQQYLNAKRYHFNYTRAKKRKFFNLLELKLSDSHNPKEFYSALSHFRPKYNNVSLKESVSPERFRHFYANLFSNKNSDEYELELTGEDTELDKEFDFTELNLAIKNLSKKKAAGADSIINELWINLSYAHRLLLLDCINECWRHNNIPLSWSEIVISPIYKKGDKNDPSNYRPISLVNTCAKLLTSLMTYRLDEWCEKHKKLSEFQAAYRKGVGCEDHVFVLNSVIENHLKNKKNVLYALFIDLSKAFDSVCHKKLWNKLSNIGLSKKFIEIIKCLYKNAKAKVRTLHGESEYFNIEKGVLQGECLSAKLFTLFIDDIVKTLHESNVASLKIASKEIHMLMYADDIVILASNVFDLQNKIDIIISYFNNNDLTVNLEKTKVVMFKYGRERKDKPKIFWDDFELQYVSMYTYLGVNFHSNLSTSQVCSQFLKKAKNAENLLFNVMWRSKIRTFASRIKLYHSLVKSMLTYCSPIWCINHVEKLEIFQNNFIRRLLNLPRKSPNWYGRLETNCNSIEVSYLKNLLYFWVRLISRPKESLLYVCYKQLRVQCENSRMKHNWYRSLRDLLVKWDCQDILDIELSSENIEYLNIRSRISCLVSKIETKSKQLDIIKMQESTSMPYYLTIKTHCKTEDYLNYKISWNNTIIIAQLRNNLSRIGQTNLRDLSFSYNQCDDNLCEKCFEYEIENCFHIMFKCSRYKTLRHRYLEKYNLPQNPMDYLVFFTDLDYEKIKNICDYVNHMLAIRNKV
jgi:hypothetical protein